MYTAEGTHDHLDTITTLKTNRFYAIPGLVGTPVTITIVPQVPIDAIEVIEK
jgi:hypothetical protein